MTPNSYNFWLRDSELAKIAKTWEPLQRTASHHVTSQPQKSVDPNQCDNTTPDVIAHRTTSSEGEDPAATSYLRDNLSDRRQLSQHSPIQVVNIENNAAGQTPFDGSSGSSPYTSIHTSTPSPGLSTTLTGSQQIPSVHPFFHHSHRESWFPEEPHSKCSVNNHRSETHASIGPSTCQWEDENGLCNKIVYANKIPERVNACNHFKQLSAAPNSELKCRWKGCRRLEPLRRDTIFRHIREVHLGMFRRKAHTY